MTTVLLILVGLFTALTILLSGLRVELEGFNQGADLQTTLQRRALLRRGKLRIFHFGRVHFLQATVS